jgi:hypothetical protein
MMTLQGEKRASNTRFTYKYCSATGEETSKSVIFANPEGSNVTQIDYVARQSFIKGPRERLVFKPELVGLPELRPRVPGEVVADENGWYEFVSVEDTRDADDDLQGRSTDRFLWDVGVMSDRISGRR